MLCRNCGYPVEPGQSFCARCGAPVEAEQPMQQAPYEQPATYEPYDQPMQMASYDQPMRQQPYQPTYQPRRQPYPPAKNRKPLIAAVAIVLCVAILAGAVVLAIARPWEKTLTKEQMYRQYEELLVDAKEKLTFESNATLGTLSSLYSIVFE